MISYWDVYSKVLEQDLLMNPEHSITDASEILLGFDPMWFAGILF